MKAQNDLQVRVLGSDRKEALIGANVYIKGTDIGAVTDADGIARIINPPPGGAILAVSYIGYRNAELAVTLPVEAGSILTVFLALSIGEGDEIIVSSTRGSRTIRDAPTRVEVITLEELEEKAVMNSANIATLLRETTGIQVQQTSQNSGNANIRIQGLDGRHTQILKDGFPVFAGFSGGLSIMQIPPLDLRQVEVVKGSNSTLFGGGAIAGLVNLLSKTPQDEPELSLMYNQTSAQGSTVNAFYAEKYGKTGLSVYGSGTYQREYDAESNLFSNLPKTKTANINPVFYYYGQNGSRVRADFNVLYDDRIGGYMAALKPDYSGDAYSEENRSWRYGSALSYERKLSERSGLNLKNSVYRFDRRITVPGYDFHGKQTGSFSEILYSRTFSPTEWIFGGNVFTDSFSESLHGGYRNYSDYTVGGFVQNTWSIAPSLTMETGIRTDYNNDFGTFILPRVSILYRFSNDLSVRAGGGSGYKEPGMFTEEAETVLFRHINPINRKNTKAERSTGGNFDINYRTVVLDKLGISLNQLFFYTELKNSLLLMEAGGDEQSFLFVNAGKPARNRGIESNLKLSMDDYSLYLNYAFVDARYPVMKGYRQKPLTPKHNLGCVLMYEAEERWRIGLEAYYTGIQYLNDYTRTNRYWIAGFMIMREFSQFTLFLNFENFTDTKQSKYGNVVHPPANQPQFSEIWAPMDGFIANGGIRIRL